VSIKTNFIRLRRKSDDVKLSGLSASLLPEGGSAPGDLISLVQNSGINWQYDFPGQVTNGTYILYVNGVPVLNDGEPQEVRIIRNGIISAGDTDFAKDSW